MQRCSVYITFVISVHYIVFCVISIKEVFGTIIKFETNGSTIIGKKLYTVYENIPYAAFFDIAYADPPLGKLRFKDPRGPRMLMPFKTFDFSKKLNDTYKFMSIENCLHLTVYMPLSDKVSNSLPVAVWVYENSDDHDPDFLIEEEVLVVTISFRTSIMGFLNTEDEFAKGNMGAKDVVMSLRWIRHNIYYFYGNLNRVTVIGSGIGANIVASLLVSSNAEDLFTGLIIQSGSALAPADFGMHSYELIKKLHNRINGPFDKFNKEKLYEQLRETPVKKLRLISRDLFDSTEIRDCQRPITAFCCSVERTKRNAFIYEHPLEVYNKKMANNNVNVMMGFINLEALFKLKGFIKNRHLLKHLNNNFQYILPFPGRSDLYNSKRYKKIRKRIMNFYFINGTISERSLRRYVKYHSDQVIYPLLHQARLQSEGCKNVYLYRFVYNGCLNIKWKSLPKLNWRGATVGDEICYLFKCKLFSDVYNREIAAAERLFIRKIAKLLGNFIKYGNPTPNTKTGVLGRLKWKPILPNQTLTALNLGKSLKIVTLPEQKRMEFWYRLKEDFFNDDKIHVFL